MMYKLTGKAMKAMPGSIIQKEIIKQLNVYRKKLSMEPITMHKDKPITEAIARTTAFTFGRFNPPTIGHEKLIQKVASQPTNDYHIYVSRSVDPSKNPLSLTNKISFLKKMFPKFANKIEPNPSNMILDLATNLYNKGYTSITMVVGSDRVREFETMLKKYNDVHSRHGYYNFKTINVVSAGERDPDEEGATGISASKLRTYAHNGDFKSFEKGVPNTLTKKEKQSLFNSVRKGMNLKELDESDWDAYGGYDLKPIASLEQFEIQQIRDLYIREMIFNIGEQVHNVHLEVKGKVVRRGTNYVVLEDTNNNLHKSWIWDCVPITANRDVEIREIDLNVDYGFKAVSEIKEQPKLIEEKKKKIFNELKKELVNMNNEKKEGYDIGYDWAQHNAKMTPGEPQYDPNYLSKPSTPEENMYKPSKPIENITQISTQEIEDWSYAKDTIDKYRERYGDNYKSKIDEVKKKMMSFKDYKKDKK